MSSEENKADNIPNSFFLDGQEIPFRAGQTIMDAALAAGVYIPHLCHRPGLTPHGSCKLCTVDIHNRIEASSTSDRRKKTKFTVDEIGRAHV